jgi:RNA polymerase sigma factor (sigma-70 family)
MSALVDPAFDDLVEDQRADLHAHCYRMLGSLHDADDALQDTLLRAWRGLPGFRGRSSLRTWLYRIATNVCLDAIARRPKRVLPIDYGPDEREASLWIDPYPDATLGVEDGEAAPEARYERREALELAFVAALQHLPPRQRAALIARDVLGFSAKEAAEALETSVASVNGALLRARRTVAERLPQRSQQATLRSLGDRRLQEIVERFADAFERGDVDAILAPAGRRRDLLDAALPRPLRGEGGDRELLAHARRPTPAAALRHRARQRATGAGHLPARRRDRRLPAARPRRPHPPRRPDRGRHRVPHAGALPALRTARATRW